MFMHWQDYEAVGADLVLFGSRDGVLSGDSWSELELLCSLGNIAYRFAQKSPGD